MTCLPFVVAVNVDVEQLGTAQGVLLGKAYHQSGAEETVGLTGEVGFQIYVIWFVEDTVDGYVQRIYRCGVGC